MKETSNDILDTWFEEISGTLSGNRFFYDFLCEIKSGCPNTTFYGTDVGHQYDTTGARYLKYLEDNGQKSSKNYALAEECIAQGKSYYESEASYDGKSELRESFMVANFKAAYLRQGGGKIMGIYGSYHTALSNDDVMAARLKADLGDVISSVKISSVMIWQKNPYALGISVSGLVFLVMLFVPNILWACANKPQEIEEAQKRENKALLIFERIGEVLVTASLLVFTSLNPAITKLPDGIYFRWNIVLWFVALILMILYEFYWIKYFKSERTPMDTYSSFAGFPVAGATLPVLAVFILGIYSRNLVVIISAVVLGIGHIGIHLAHKREAVAYINR